MYESRAWLATLVLGLLLALPAVDARAQSEPSGPIEEEPGGEEPGGEPTLAEFDAFSGDPMASGRGFDATRTTEDYFPWEHVDPFNGNLLLTFTDLELPGNAGFNLRIQRTFNSKAPGEDSWAGAGWTLHLGRLIETSSPTGAPRVLVEMPDGSQHPAYVPFGQPFPGAVMMTKDYWVVLGDFTVLMPNGLRYEFNHFGPVVNGAFTRYVTRISDPFGNEVLVRYAAATSSTAPRDAIARIEQRVGNDTRYIDFDYDSTARKALRRMQVGDRVWTYEQDQLIPSLPWLSRLREVHFPESAPWRFDYSLDPNPTPTVLLFHLREVATPQGGRVVYDWQDFGFRYCGLLGTIVPPGTLGHGIKSRKVYDGNNVVGTWTYSYARGSGFNETWVDGPCGRTEYEFYGLVPPASQSQGHCQASQGESNPTYRMGSLEERRVREGGDVLRRDRYLWRASTLLSPDAEWYGPILGLGIVAALPRGNETTTYSPPSSGSATQATYHTYSEANFNDFGRPWKTDQYANDGKHRVATRDFAGFSSYYIKNRTDWEKLEEDGAGSSLLEQEWDFRGFLEKRTEDGISITFGKGSWGNVAWQEDEGAPNRNRTSYEYRWGAVRQVTTPAYTIHREVTTFGEISQEWRGSGSATSYQYDKLGRVTSITPPWPSAAAAVAYDWAGRWRSDSRNGYSVTTLYDGFGREVGTRDSGSPAIRTEAGYDACGRLAWSSRPLWDNEQFQGDTFSYDAVGRVRWVQHADSSARLFSYPQGIDVAITDESGFGTYLARSGFSPDEPPRITEVTDGLSQRTRYTYDVAGRLRSVDPLASTAGSRTFTYNQNGLLESERHPESGTTDYDYYANGWLWHKTDAAGRTTEMRYDGNGRLTNVFSADGTYDKVFAYDERDNKTLQQNAHAATTFVYDQAYRLRERHDAIAGNHFVTRFDADASDRLVGLTYANLTKVHYQRDVRGLVTRVWLDSGATLADGFTYNASGLPTGFTTGGGVRETMGFDSRVRLASVGVRKGQTTLLSLAYTLDGSGNVTRITDARPQMSWTDVAYDNLHRLYRAVLGGSYAEQFRYNGGDGALGNLTLLSRSGLPQLSFGYDHGTSRLRDVQGSGLPTRTFGYDAVGNLTSSGGASFGYSPFNQLTSAPGVDYTYDAADQRVRRTRGEDTTIFLRGADEELLAEYGQCGGYPLRLRRNTVHLEKRLLAELGASGGTSLSASLLAASNHVSEGAGFARVRVVLSLPGGGQALATARLVVSAVAGTASPGSDYVWSGDRIVEFPVGSPHGAEQWVDVPLVNDGVTEPPESFRLRLVASSCELAVGSGDVELTIVDDEPTVALTGPLAVAEATSAAAGSARVTTPEGTPLSLPVTVRWTTAPGTATPGADYTPPSEPQVVVAAGTPSGATISPLVVPIVNDTLPEPDESFEIRLQEVVGGTVGAANVAVATIVDDDATVAFTAPTSAVDEAAGPAIATVRLTTSHGAATTNTLTVAYATAPGTAGAGDDFLAISGVLTFPANTPSGTLRTLAVPLVDDRQVEVDERFTLHLGQVAGGALGLAVHEVTIEDDDPTLRFTTAAANVLEAAGAAQATVVVVTPHGRPTTAAASATFAPADGTALAPADYQATAGTLHVPAGTGSGTSFAIAVPIVSDTRDEPEQTFQLALSDVVGGAIGSPASLLETIVDDDDPPTVAIADLALAEGDTGLSEAVFSLSLSAASDYEVQLTASTGDQTAMRAIDYYHRTEEVRFPVGSTQASVLVPVLGDHIAEVDETFTVELALPQHVTVADGSATATIVDDDLPGFVAGDVTIAEGGVAKVRVYLTPPVEEGMPPASVEVTTVDGSAGVDDYTPLEASLVFMPDRFFHEVHLPTLVDGTLEGPETFSLRLSNPVGAAIAHGDGTITILEPKAGTDFNADRRTDVLWQNELSGDLLAWFMAPGLGPSGEATFTPPGLGDGTWGIAATGKLHELDGPDLIWRHRVSGDLVAWLMQGVEREVEVKPTPEQTDPALELAGSGDFNRDGHTDLLWRHGQTGALSVWLMEGTVRTAEVPTTPAGLADLAWQIVGVADLDRDGNEDLLWRHRVSGRLVVWFMAGTTRLSGRLLSPASEPTLKWEVVAVRDYDGDGNPDLLWRDVATGALRYWLMDGIYAKSDEHRQGLPVETGWTVVGPQ